MEKYQKKQRSYLLKTGNLKNNNQSGPGALIKWLFESVGCGGIYDICEKKGEFRAAARTVIGFLVEGQAYSAFFDASLKGSISRPKGINGFGWDPIFVPEGMNITLAEMTNSELEAIKMRRKAAKKMVRYLNERKRTPDG